jgi:hypothetical protein
MATRRFTMSQWARSASLISRPVAAPAAAVGGATDMVATALRGRVALCRGEKVALARDRHEHARETCARVFDRQRVAEDAFVASEKTPGSALRRLTGSKHRHL